ncbi:MAG: hypothetical protein HOL73_06335 [Nitrosopumilus sp.]|jgi:hypothetical protein|nr:hypothetical protein [Nitrosopumilus sp.]
MNLKNHIFIIIGALIISVDTLFISDAYAYLDPSSGSMAIQAILGVLVGVGITLKVFWEKIKYSISNKIKK